MQPFCYTVGHWKLLLLPHGVLSGVTSDVGRAGLRVCAQCGVCMYNFWEEIVRQRLQSGGVHSLGRGGLLPPGAFDVLSPHSSITAGVCAY